MSAKRFRSAADIVSTISKIRSCAAGAAGVAGVAVARHQLRFDEAGDDDRHRALVGARPLGELVERQRGRLPKLLKDEELGPGEPELVLSGAVGKTKESNQAADRIENALAVGHRPLSDNFMGAQRLQDE